MRRGTFILVLGLAGAVGLVVMGKQGFRVRLAGRLLVQSAAAGNAPNVTFGQSPGRVSFPHLIRLLAKVRFILGHFSFKSCRARTTVSATTWSRYQLRSAGTRCQRASR